MSVDAIIERILRNNDKVKYLIYKTQESTIAKTLTIGQLTDLTAVNLPNQFDTSSIISEVMGSPITLNGEKFVFDKEWDSIIFVTNSNNAISQTACIIPYYESSCYVIFAFAAGKQRLNFDRLLHSLMDELQTQRLFLQRPKTTKPVMTRVLTHDFSQLDQIVFQHVPYKYLQQPNPFADQPVCLFVQMDVGNNDFALYTQQAAQLGRGAHVVVGVSCESETQLRQVLKKTIFGELLNFVKFPAREPLSWSLFLLKNQRWDISGSGHSFAQLNEHFARNELKGLIIPLPLVQKVDDRLGVFGLQLFSGRLQLNTDKPFVIALVNCRQQTLTERCDQINQLANVGMQLVVLVQNAWGSDTAAVKRRLGLAANIDVVLDEENVFGLLKQRGEVFHFHNGQKQMTQGGDLMAIITVEQEKKKFSYNPTFAPE